MTPNCCAIIQTIYKDTTSLAHEPLRDTVLQSSSPTEPSLELPDLT